MATKELLDFDAQNQDAYDDLIVTIEAKDRAISLLIAVCDDLNLREQIIAKYEAELQPHFRPYRVTLARGEPSLYDALAQLVQKEEYLRQGGKAVVTVTGSEQLYFLKLGNERSEQEIFFGYLQWTREALREFPYAIILWVTNQMLVNLIKKAPDFWSWREGVFRFVSRKTIAVSSRDIELIRLALHDSELSSFNNDDRYLIPIEDLQQLIQQKEQQGKKDSSLATLYSSLGNIYRKRLERGEFQDYQNELSLAIEYYRKAIELQKELGLEIDLATSLNNLASLYRSQGRYNEAEPLFQQALELRKRLLGEDHSDVAASLNNLALLYKAQGRYTEAEPLYQQALELRKRLLGKDHPDVAASLNNLAGLYYAQGRYNEAEPLFQQALELRKRLLGEDHPDVVASLNTLALLYKAQGRYTEAEPLYQQALELSKRLLGEDHPSVATSLNNYELERTKRLADRNLQSLQDLTEILDLPDIPKRIEGYDISHVQGSNAVASQVVFIDGVPAKQHYRHYNIKNPNVRIGHSDDFASLAEVIRRRFRKYAEGKIDKEKAEDFPDLVMIDGGKGQLSSVVAVLQEMDLLQEVKVISLAKQREEIFLPGESLPLTTDAEQPGVQLLRRLRDEAHRFAIILHRQKRLNNSRRSRLDEIPGLGFHRQKLLLAHFHSVDYIREASLEQLMEVSGIGRQLAQEIYDYFNPV